MSSTLSCDFRLNMTGTAQFWWPLVFEAMRRIGFAFDNPRRLPEHRGSYYCVNRDTGEDAEGTDVTFLAAWKTVVEYSDAAVEFWPTTGDRFKLKASVSLASTSQQAHIRLKLPIESLPMAVSSESDNVDANLHETRRRVRIWLAAIAEMYEMCGSCTSTLSWERWGSQYVVGIIGAAGESSGTDALMQTVRLIGLLENARIMERPLPHDSVLRILDPIPIPWRGSWSKVSLVT